MIEKVEYIASIFKIDVDNSYIVTDIAEELSKIDSFDDFREWLKGNVNHVDAQFMNPYKTFTFLVHKYLKKSLELKNTERIRNGKKYVIELSNKVRQVSYYVEDKGATYENFKINGKEAFSSFDKSQLDKVGGLLAAVRLQKSVSGADALADRLEELAYDLIVTNIIEYQSQDKTETNVNKLLNEAIKKI